MSPRFWFLDSRLRPAMTLWGVMAIALSIKAAVPGYEHSVFSVYAASARHWWADKPLYILYPESEQPDFFRYSPTFAVAFSPFLLLPNPLDEIAWSLASLGLLLFALHVSLRDVFSEYLWTDAFGNAMNVDRCRDENTFLAIALAVSAIGLWSCQSNALLLALVLLGLSAMAREHWWTAATCLALAVFIKLWPAALVLLLMLFWPRRLTLRFAVMCVVVAVIPFLTRPPSIVLSHYEQWTSSLLYPSRDRWPGFRDAWTIWSDTTTLFGGNANTAAHRLAYLTLQALSPLVVLGWCVLQWTRSRKRSALLRGGIMPDAPQGRLLSLIFSIWAVWVLLFGPASEQLTYGILAPTAACATILCLREKRFFVGIVLTTLGLSLLSTGEVEHLVRRLVPFSQSLLPLCAIVLFLWLALRERKCMCAFLREMKSPSKHV
jgi:alpha-1,2-mannosyltransferase